MNPIYITKPYKILESTNLIFPKDVINKTLDLVPTRTRGVVVFIKDVEILNDIKIFEKPLFGGLGAWGKWIYFKKGRLYSCKADLSNCEDLFEIKEDDNLDIIDSLNKYIVLGNKKDEVIIRSFDGNFNYYTKSLKEIIKIPYKDLELLLLDEKRRRKLFINGKLFEIDEYCYSRDTIWQTLAFKTGNKIYAIHGSLHGGYKYIETLGKRIKCLTRGDVGSVSVDNKTTFVINDQEIYEIPGEVEALAILQDSVLVYNPSTKWLTRYFEKEIKYITRVDPFEKIRFIDQIGDSLIIQIGNSVRDYRGIYSKVISSVLNNEIVSVYNENLVIDRGNYLEIIDRSNNVLQKIPKREFIKCMAYGEDLYCLDTINNVLYRIDLLKKETIDIGYLKGGLAKVYIGKFRDVLDIEIKPSIKSLHDNTLYIYTPLNPTQNSNSIEIHSIFILGEYRENMVLDTPEPIIRIKNAYLKTSSKGLSKYCRVKPSLNIYLETIDRELASKFNYLIVLRNSSSDGNYIEYIFSGSDLIHNENHKITLCVDKDVLYMGKLYVDLYIVDKDNIEHRYIINTSDVNIIQRDIDILFNQVEDVLHIEIMDERNEAFLNEIRIQCGQNGNMFKVNDPMNKYVIYKKDLKDLCEKEVRIDLWVEDEEFIWGFSRKISISDNKRLSYSIPEDRIHTVLMKSRLSSNNRLVEDYEVIILPREKMLRVKVLSDSYIIYSGDGEIFFNKLRRGQNIIPLKETSEEYIWLRIFDGFYQENLVIKTSNYIRDLIYAHKHANILKEVLMPRGR